MTPYATAGIVMVGLVTVMCGSVMLFSEMMERHRNELGRIYSFNQRSRT